MREWCSLNFTVGIIKSIFTRLFRGRGSMRSVNEREENSMSHWILTSDREGLDSSMKLQKASLHMLVKVKYLTGVARAHPRSVRARQSISDWCLFLSMCIPQYRYIADVKSTMATCYPLGSETRMGSCYRAINNDSLQQEFYAPFRLRRGRIISNVFFGPFVKNYQIAECVCWMEL